MKCSAKKTTIDLHCKCKNSKKKRRHRRRQIMNISSVACRETTSVTDGTDWARHNQRQESP